MTTIDWSALRHAYGPASDIPSLLERARTIAPATASSSGPWFSLWSALCHQDDVYPASYAAVPVLVDIASDSSDAIAREALFLAASIELCRQDADAPATVPELRAAYEHALASARPLVAALLRDRAGADARCLVADAVFRGDFELARELLDEQDDE